MPARRRSPSRPLALAGQRWVVTAGPTREHLDDIRFLTNASTGRMGIEVARAAARRGAEVVLVLGPTHLPPPPGVETVRITSVRDLLKATRAAAANADVVVFTAAPSDWRPRTRQKGKPPRAGGGFDLPLEATEDVAATLGRRKGRRIHVGFALEVAAGTKRARTKLATKRFDAIVLNGPANFGAGGGDALWIPAEGDPAPLPTTTKARLAGALVTRTARLVRGSEAGA
ncbi:MAG: phosphopantothenoylcysteine decarboxylase [Planctomycetota bacterium]|nr:phosphopantothenoylcysteine decarboxylase [Planctomycetota bacterium]MCB9899781.1 phosphopantothenoylcysteine decarboxylase [Planctomycetota bacterium]